MILGYALIQLPDLLLFIYDYLKSRYDNRFNVITFVEPTQSDFNNGDLPLENFRRSINSIDVTSNDYKGKEKRWQNSLISPDTNFNESPSATNDEITKIKRVLDEILCWRNNADENFCKLLDMMNKEVPSRRSEKNGTIKNRDVKKVH